MQSRSNAKKPTAQAGRGAAADPQFHRLQNFEQKAKQLVRFYQLTDRVRVDVSEGGVLHGGCTNHVAFGEAADLLETAFGIGRALMTPAKPGWWNPKSWRKE